MIWVFWYLKLHQLANFTNDFMSLYFILCLCILIYPDSTWSLYFLRNVNFQVQKLMASRVYRLCSKSFFIWIYETEVCLESFLINFFKVGEFKCGDCGKEFTSQKSLAGHKTHCKADSTLKKEPSTKKERSSEFEGVTV